MNRNRSSIYGRSLIHVTATALLALSMSILSVQSALAYGSGGEPPRSRTGKFEQALQSWNTAAARKVLETTRDKYGSEDHMVRFLEARLYFFEGDYDQATAIVEELGLKPDSKGQYGDFTSILKAVTRHRSAMKKFTSEHFILHVPPGKDEILIPYMIETAEAAFAALQSDLGGSDEELGVPLRIEVYPDVRAFSEISTLTLEEIKTSGTVALCKYNRLMITSPRTLARGYRWRDTLNHEMVHYFLSRLSANKLPLWLHEGIARFEERRWRKAEVGEMNAIEQSILYEARAGDYWVPLSAMEPSLAKLPNAGDTGLAFAELHGMAGLLYQKGGYPLFQKIVRLYRDGMRTPQVLKQIGIKSPESLFEEFQRKLAKTKLEPLKGRKFLPLAEGDSDSPDTWGKLPKKARQRIRLGDLLRDRGRFLAAEKEYELAAAEVDGRDPTIAGKLAEARVFGGRYDQAWNGIQKELKMYDGDPRIHLAAAKAAYYRKDLGKASELLETTIGIHPFQTELFRLLSDTWKRLGQKEKSDQARKTEEILNSFMD